jgi:hypothetical protein
MDSDLLSQAKADRQRHTIAGLATTIGPPFFANAATAPLLQHWFSRTV